MKAHKCLYASQQVVREFRIFFYQFANLICRIVLEEFQAKAFKVDLQTTFDIKNSCELESR